MSYEPTPGSVRIVSTSPSPMDAKAEVMQADGTWLPLRVCSIATHLDAQKMNTATIVVEPSSIDLIALLDSYDILRVEEAPTENAGAELLKRFVAALDKQKSVAGGLNMTRADAMECL